MSNYLAVKQPIIAKQDPETFKIATKKEELRKQALKERRQAEYAVRRSLNATPKNIVPERVADKIPIRSSSYNPLMGTTDKPKENEDDSRKMFNLKYDPLNEGNASKSPSYLLEDAELEFDRLINSQKIKRKPIMEDPDEKKIKEMSKKLPSNLQHLPKELPKKLESLNRSIHQRIKTNLKKSSDPKPSVTKMISIPKNVTQIAAGLARLKGRDITPTKAKFMRSDSKNKEETEKKKAPKIRPEDNPRFTFCFRCQKWHEKDLHLKEAGARMQQKIVDKHPRESGPEIGKRRTENSSNRDLERPLAQKKKRIKKIIYYESEGSDDYESNDGFVVNDQPPRHKSNYIKRRAYENESDSNSSAMEVNNFDELLEEEEYSAWYGKMEERKELEREARENARKNGR